MFFFYCISSSSDTACDLMILPSVHYYCVSGLYEKICFLSPGFTIPNNSSVIIKDDI